MTKILRLQAENVKRLTAIDITPAGACVVVGGRNGSGKSSTLDSIAMAIGGAAYVPKVPVRRGADSAEIVVTLDNGIVVKRTFTASGNTYLKVVKDGKPVSSGQALLDELTGKLAFDPLAFIRLDDKRQAETLRKLTGLDFTAHDAARKKAYDDRTAVNKRLAEMRGAVAALPEYPEAPAEEVSSTEVLAQIEVAQEHNAELTTLMAAKTAAQGAVDRATESVKRTATLIATLEKQLADARAQLAKDTKAREAADKVVVEAADAVEGFQPIDTTELKAQLSTAEETNRKVRANVARAKAVAEGLAKKVESDALTAKIESLDAAKEKALAAAKFPVPGLSFADDVVTYNGLPFTEASGAEQLRVSVAIGAALNSKLRVMIVRDGAFLDDEGLEILRQMAEQLDLQVWLERVSTGAECSVIIEAGEVVEEASAAAPVAEAVPPVTPKPAAKAPVAKPVATTAPTPVAAKPAAARKPAPF